MIKIDCHLHLSEIGRHVPQWWLEEMYRPYGGEPVSTDGAWMVDLLDRSGVDAGLVQGGDIRRTTYHPDHPDDHNVYIPNDYTAEQVALYPDRLYGVACIDPFRDIPGAVQELERCVNEFEFRSLKLLPSYLHFSPRDPALDPLYKKAIELDIPVHFFTGFTPTINAMLEYADPILLDDLGQRFRDLKVLVYINFPWVDQAIGLVAKHPNFYADMCYFAGGTSEQLYDALMKFRSYDVLHKVIYGSDNSDKARAGDTVGSVPDLYRSVNDVADRRGTPRISDDELDNILGGTASQFFKIPE